MIWEVTFHHGNERESVTYFVGANCRVSDLEKLISYNANDSLSKDLDPDDAVYRIDIRPRQDVDMLP